MESGIMLYVDCKTADVFEQIKALKEIGVRHTFINAKHPELERVLEAVRDSGIICDNLHSEYRFTCNDEIFAVQDMCRPGVKGDIMAERIMENVKKCAENKIPVIVVHPPYDAPEVSINEYTRQRYTAIGDFARKMGVTVAFENLAYTRNLEYVMSLVPDAKFCWDCGHEYSRLKDEKPMPKFGERLAALHIHDNSIVKDDHQIPYTGKVDFEDVGKRLAESGYDGTLMLEILYGKGEGNSTEPTYRDFALKAKLAAERVIETVKKYRE